MKKTKKNNKYFTPKEVLGHFIKEPLLFIFLIAILIYVALAMIVWDGTIPINSGLTWNIGK
jgi:hypothetical protein